MRVDGNVELHFGRFLQRLALHLGDGLVHHLAVEVVTDCGDVPALRLAEQVTGATDLQIAHGDLEATPQVGGLTDRAQPLVRLFGEHLIARMEEVCVGPLTRAPDPASQLVQLPESEEIGALDDERVHRRHVDARLDDRGAHEYVVLAFPEVDDDLFEAAFVELTVGDGDTRLGYELA